MVLYFFQIIVALVIGIISIPILSTFAIIIFFEDGLPILFKQKRVGKNNELFLIYKLRTMKKSTPDIPTHLLKDSEKMYTYFGPIIRKLSIDELPQLINIIKGDINFVGPRPALHNQDDLIKLRSDKGINCLKPGITGWAQVNGRDKLSIVEKVSFDEYYLKNKSFLLDAKILVKTIIKVFRGSDVL